MLITGTPSREIPYTLSPPVTVRCDSCHCSSPSDGKCVLERTIAVPSETLSRPIAHPFEEIGGCRASRNRSGGGGIAADFPGGAAEPTMSTNTMPLARSANAR
jgi:hypothetical protein